jgi:predicted negative regulator of RcsB-dependent stress response
MKRVERHHLKQNDLQVFTKRAREVAGSRSREMTALAAVVVIAGLAALGYSYWSSRTSARAHELLAEAVAVSDARVGAPIAPGTPGAGMSFPTEPQRAEAALAKFKAAADAYPTTDAGTYARYLQAATLVDLGRPADAAPVYQQVIDRAGDRIYGQMARLGLADSQSRAGQYDQAINGFKDLAQRKDGPLPIDAVLMQLGRTYRDAGKRADAQQTFNRVVEEFPDSPFNADAKKELDSLKLKS